MRVNHLPGRHCASTALANLCRFHQASLSEAMCFGLGEGLGIYYVGAPGLSPSRLMHGRSLAFEQQFFTRLGIPFQWDQHADPVDAEQSLRRVLDSGRPAVIQTDIYYLPYYQSKTHFSGHLITVWGYDDARQVFQVTDTERTEVYEVASADLRRARYCKVPPFPMEGNLFAPEAIAVPADIGERVWDAVQSNSRRLLHNDSPFDGLQALQVWQDELPAWGEFPDWAWTARLAYQTIMKRGTGGGAFRLMYADFLEEAATLNPKVRERNLAPQMRAVGRAWDELALALKAASEQANPEFSAVAAKLQTVRQLEGRYHERTSDV